MSIATRLDRIVPSLSARQRAVLVFRALAAGQEPDPALNRIDDERERRAFNRYMGLFYVVNIELDGMLHSLLYQVQRLAEQATPELLREAAGMVEEQTGDKADPKVVKAWRRAKIVNATEFFLGVAEEVRASLLEDVLQRWRELGSLEAVWEELSQEFDGESLLLPELREKVEQARAELQEQLQRLGEPRRLPGPDAAVTEAVRGRIERAFDLLGLVEPAGKAADTDAPGWRT